MNTKAAPNNESSRRGSIYLEVVRLCVWWNIALGDPGLCLHVENSTDPAGSGRLNKSSLLA